MKEKDQVPSEDLSLDEFLRMRDRIDRSIREQFQRRITIMFTDIVASTEFFETRGDLEGRTMVHRHNDIVCPIVEKHGGHVVKGLGDGLMVSFEEPQAGAKAAVEIQSSLRSYNGGKSSQDQIHIKISLHFGAGIVEKQDIFGDVVNTAARLCSQAGCDEIVASQDFAEVTREDPEIVYEYIGAKSLKGKVAPMDLHRIIWDRAGEGDVKRSASAAGAQRALSERDAITLHFLLEVDQLRSIAYLEGDQAQMARYSEGIPCDMAELGQLAESVGECLSRVDDWGKLNPQDLAALKTVCRKLHDAIISDGLRGFIRDNRTTSLVLQVDEQLVGIPWELLYDGQEFWCCRFSMGRLIAASQRPVGRSREPSRASASMLIVADPGGDLPASAKEAIAIRREAVRELGGASLSIDVHEEDATCEFILSHIADYDFFHFAGHFDFDSGDAAGSGLLLADGKLELGRLLSLSKVRPLPSLVFANACESGRVGSGGYKDQTHTLANAFISAGVRHYIGSTMELFDRASATFAEVFYKSLARQASVGEAMRQARLRCLTLFGEETVTWASYVLYGDPTIVCIKKDAPAPRDQPRPAKLLPAQLKLAAVFAAVLLVVVFLWRWVERGPNEADISQKGVALIHSGRTAQAEEAFNSLDKKGEPYYLGMAAVYLSKGNVEESEKMLSQLGPDDSDPGATILRGHIAFLKGSPDQAESAYSKAIQGGGLQPWQEAECCFGLGRIHSARKEYDRAVEQLDRAINLDQNFVQAYTAKGALLERMGKLQNAVQSYEKGAAINGDDPINASLYRRSKEELSRQASAEQRARVDGLVADLVKLYREGPKSVEQRDEWSSRPLFIFFIDPEPKGLPAVKEGEDALISEQIAYGICDSVRFNQVERALLDKLLEELKLSSTALADPQTALRLGKILSANLLVTGSILRHKGQLQLNLRAIDCETTRIAATVTEVCRPGEDAPVMVERAAAQLKARLASAYPLRVRVAEVQDRAVVLDAGKAAGLVPGMKLKVVEKEGRDVELEITEVEEASCLAVVAGGEAIVQKGWRAQHVPGPAPATPQPGEQPT